MAAQEKNIGSKGKTPVHVQLSSSTSSFAHGDSDSNGSHHNSSIPSPVTESSLPFDFSALPTLKSGLKSIKSHQSDALAQGAEYFWQRNFKLTKQLQEYVRLDWFIKQENAFLKAKVASLKTLVDDITGSNRSLRKQLRKKDKQLEKLINVQHKTAPSPPQVQVLFNTSASVSGI